jgi:hypothetical protein
VQSVINPDQNRSAFSRGVQDQADNISQGNANEVQQPEPAAPKATRRRSAAAASDPIEQPSTGGNYHADALQPLLNALSGAFGVYLRLQAVKIASQPHFAENFESTRTCLTWRTKWAPISTSRSNRLP